MKFLRTFFFLSLASVILFSCKKSNDAATPGINLAGTVWAGQFRYTTGAYTGQQAFSISINADSTVTWSDVSSTRPAGKWKTIGDMVTITLPNGTILTANVPGDSWSNFNNPAVNGFAVDNLSRTAVPAQKTLENSIWTGSYDVYSLKINFLAGDKLEYTVGGALYYSGGYTIRGAGIYFDKSGLLSADSYYGVLMNNNSFSGFASGYSGFPSKSYYRKWDAKK